MGLQLSNFNRKLFICSLGIIILTYGICVFYKKPDLKEGMVTFPEVLVAATTALNSLSLPQSAKLAAITFAKIAASAGTMVSAVQTSSAGVIATDNFNAAKAQVSRAKALMKTQMTAMANRAAIIAKSTKDQLKTSMEISSAKAAGIANTNVKAAAQTALSKSIDASQKALDRARSVIQKFSFFRLFAIVGSIYQWGLPFVQCGWYWFVNIKQCFFWYLLDIIGQILYLPFGILLWLLPILQPPADLFWNTLDDLDCLFFDTTGFHFLHYSPTIIKNCYSCSPTTFPNIDVSDLFQII
jgi:hypothetical protein